MFSFALPLLSPLLWVAPHFFCSDTTEPPNSPSQSSRPSGLDNNTQPDNHAPNTQNSQNDPNAEAHKTNDMDALMPPSPSPPKDAATNPAAAAAAATNTSRRSVSTSPRHSPTPSRSRSRSPNSKQRTIDERSRSRSPKRENVGNSAPSSADTGSYRPSFDEVRGQKPSATSSSSSLQPGNPTEGSVEGGEGAVKNEGDQSQSGTNQVYVFFFYIIIFFLNGFLSCCSVSCSTTCKILMFSRIFVHVFEYLTHRTTVPIHSEAPQPASVSLAVDSYTSFQK